MINEKMYGLGDEPSAIRELFAYGMARKAEIGAENVFDFSIGNPSVPAPDLVRETMLELLDMDPVTLHAYSPAAGLPEVKEAIAAYLSPSTAPGSRLPAAPSRRCRQRFRASSPTSRRCARPSGRRRVP